MDRSSWRYYYQLSQTILFNFCITISIPCFFIIRGKSISGFKASKNDLLGANTAGDLKVKPMLIYHSENPKTFKNYAKSTLPMLLSVEQQSLHYSITVNNMVY